MQIESMHISNRVLMGLKSTLNSWIPTPAVLLPLDAHLSARFAVVIQAERPKLNAQQKSSLIHEHHVSAPPPCPPPAPTTLKPQGHEQGSPAWAFSSLRQGNWNSPGDMLVERWRIGGIISDDTSSQSANISKNPPVTSHHSRSDRRLSVGWPAICLNKMGQRWLSQQSLDVWNS